MCNALHIMATNKPKPVTPEDWTNDHTNYSDSTIPIEPELLPIMTKKKVGAPKKYTLKWVKAFVIEQLQWLTTPNQDVNEEKARVNTLFIEELCVRGGFAPQRWSEWKKAYSDNVEFSEAVKMIESILETRLLKAALGNKANPIVSIFTLKVKYGWREPEQQPAQVPDLPFDQAFFLMHGRYPTPAELRQAGIHVVGPAAPTPEDEFRQITEGT
jgi:hypothetical protein